MSLQPWRERFNRSRFSTLWIAGPIDRGSPGDAAGAGALFLLACAATLTIWIRDPFSAWGYEICAFALGARSCWRAGCRGGMIALAIAGISVWGFAQLALDATVYRYATMQASLHWVALGATAWAAAGALHHRPLQLRFLRAFVRFGVGLSVAAVLEYYTSSGRVFWIFDSGYPDVWGPFLSRNNFAEFLELVLPVALWLAATDGDKISCELGCIQNDYAETERDPAGPPGGSLCRRRPQERKSGWTYAVIAAAILAAGLASASRAGAVILLIETAAVLGLLRSRSRLRAGILLRLAASTAALVAVAGAGPLSRRILLPDPFSDRRELAHSTLAMIAANPWRGFGLGTFERVYPAYATFDSGAIVDHAHDDWLEWTSEGGLPFTLLWTGLLLASTRAAFRSVWGLGVPAIFLHAAVDYPFARLGVAAWVFILIGLLGVNAERTGSGGSEQGAVDGIG